MKWLGLVALVAVCAALAALAAFLALGARAGDQSGPPKAAIVDQLSLTFPDPEFVQEVTSTLQQAGYRVDYYPGEEVTVDLYRNLASQGYELIILRVHAALPEQHPDIPSDVPPAILERVLTAFSDSVFLFTSEPYSSTRYLDEQKALRLIAVRYYQDAPRFSRYFGIAPEFIRSSMRGEFKGATLVLMGCNSLRFDRTAAALVERGAGTIVGWSGPVSAAHTDRATERLIQHLVGEGLTVGEAVAKTKGEVGPDPQYNSNLVSYPSQ